MIRKCFLTIALSLVALIAGAQIGAGQWKIHPYFVADNVANCVDVGDKVYYLVSGSLYSYDKTSQENTVMDFCGSLNDVNIKQIYYNHNKGYLFIAYDNCNIDIIKSDGTVVNVSAINDVVMHRAKSINDLTFGDGLTYVATSFGYITIEDETFRIMEARNYDLSVPSVAQVGEYKIMSLANKFYYCLASEQVEVARWHQQTENPVGNGKVYPIDDTHFFLTTSSAFYVVQFTVNSDGTLSFSPTLICNDLPTSIQKYPNGFVASHFYNGTEFKNYYYTFASDGSHATLHDGEGVYTSHENGNWWIMGKNGLAHLVHGVNSEVINPNGISIKARAYWSTYDPYMQRVLLCRTAENRVLEVWEATTGTEINSWDGTQWRKIPLPEHVEDYSGNYWIEVSPNEPDTYFFCYRKNGGIAKVQNDSIVVQYNKSNAPIAERASAISFDSKGNLWVAQPYPDSSPDVVVITPEKQALDSVTPADFIINNLGGICKNANKGFKRICFDIGAGDTKVYSPGNHNDPLIIWNNNEDLSLKQYKAFEAFFDQDNKQFTTYGWVYVKADNDGMIWIGTVSGLISFDPQQAFNPDFRINRIKVYLDEGTEVNEVLLEGTQINCIAVDAQNRKWLATNTNGIFLISADGSEIIRHFDMENSPLPSNQIFSVCYNPSTNSVLVVTSSGVLEYFCDITPSATDYSNVYAYPNPVQSAFTGYVTIKGLMDNSHVIITDATGATVATLTSTGGIAMWDACSSNGAPLKTGVYKVYAAQGTTPSTTGKPLTKIAVIK
ncbi:MAG: hypothetical protein IK100_10225 [Muribaculaceae bacterium]|nr:hypothetical protein [Muribaculaceae bacterium]